MTGKKQIRRPKSTAEPSLLPGRVWGYVRVSTAQQATHGESLETQQARIAAYAAMHGLTLTQTYIEGGVSGSVPLAKRPQGERMLAAARAGDTIIGTKLDRMFRNTADAIDILDRLKKASVSLHLIDLGEVTGNGTGKLIFTILVAVAESERERIRERITEVKVNQKARGMFVSGLTPFGYAKIAIDPTAVRPKYRLEPIPAQQAAIARMRQLDHDGMSLRGIVKVMEQDGFKLSHTTVSALLKQVPKIEAEIEAELDTVV
jgi:putative DNA-invertase from lambdoid prophage Rac